MTQTKPKRKYKVMGLRPCQALALRQMAEREAQMAARWPEKREEG